MADTPEIVGYSYRAKRDDELDLEIGDIVLVFEKNEGGRCKGMIGEREGWFPGNCTRECMTCMIVVLLSHIQIFLLFFPSSARKNSSLSRDSPSW